MESAYLIELETTFVWYMNCIQQILRTWTSNSVHLGQISKKWHVGWLILTIFHQVINQNFGYFPHIELSVVPCYQYQQVLWIRSNFDSNSSINELKNDEIKDSSSTNHRFRRYLAKNFVISWWWFLTRSQCVTWQSRKCAHQISHLQTSNGTVKTYWNHRYANCAKFMWFLHQNHSNKQGFNPVMFLELQATFILTYRQSFVGVMLGEGTLEVGSGEYQRS